MPSAPVNLLVPMDAVSGLSVPPLAITDGSADPVWVELPCRGGYVYGRRRLLTLPFDAATAATVRRWLRHERRQRAMLTPVVITLLAGAMVALSVGAGIVPPAVSAEAAQDWVQHNAAVRTVLYRPRWRRYPSLVYRWAAGAYAVAAAGVWWFALRDGESGLAMLLAFVLLLGAAMVSAFKALPVGFVRFDDAPGPP